MIAGLFISFVIGAGSAACPSGVVSVNLTSATDMLHLSDEMKCSGPGVFNATLYNSVQISKRIEVHDQKIVHITGSGFPTIRGARHNNTESNPNANAGSTGIFLVSEWSTLTINALVLEGGHSRDGGAITVLSSSLLQAIDCSFRNNSATTGGDMTCGRQAGKNRKTDLSMFLPSPTCLRQSVISEGVGRIGHIKQIQRVVEHSKCLQNNGMPKSV